MGPPMRWGFDSHRSDSRSGGGQRSDFRRDRSSHYNRDSRSNQHSSHSSRGGLYRSNHRDDNPRGQKRRHGDAFDRKDNNPRSQIAPPVPGFGISLPSKPPPAEDAPPEEKKSKKTRSRSKKLKLGLTPKGEDHESSEEDDADEETKLASNLDASGQRYAVLMSSILFFTDHFSYQFSYRGNTSSLNTPEEIAAWIEERKKRYPTLAKVAEAKEREKERQKLHAEAKKAREEALKAKKQEREEAKAKRIQQELDEKRLRVQREEAEDAAQKAKIKAEKLRRKLQKEQNRLANAERDAERARAKAEELKITSISQRRPSVELPGDAIKKEPDPSPDKTNPFANFPTDTSVPSEISVPTKNEDSPAPKPYLSPPEDSQPQSPSALSPASSSSLSISDSSEDPGSVHDDETSSSGSDDSGPEEASSKRRGEDPDLETSISGCKKAGKTKKGKKPCVYFQQGKCKNGRNCRYEHALRREGHQNGETAGIKKETGTGRRKGLFQVVSKVLDPHVLANYRLT
jgi:hypothetical protein